MGSMDLSLTADGEVSKSSISTFPTEAALLSSQLLVHLKSIPVQGKFCMVKGEQPFSHELKDGAAFLLSTLFN